MAWIPFDGLSGRVDICRDDVGNAKSTRYSIFLIMWDRTRLQRPPCGFSVVILLSIALSLVAKSQGQTLKVTGGQHSDQVGPLVLTPLPHPHRIALRVVVEFFLCGPELGNSAGC
jgi:hypothetical protein